MTRRPTTQDITWFLDLHKNKQLDLDPPYQRRSVWTRRDKQFFLDTIFRGFPSPAIFLHKSIEADGRALYHVVDGKQRLETILGFVDGKLRIGKKYGDVRLDGKRWKDLAGEESLKRQFWNYELPVEMLDTIEGSVINEVFDRLNRNSRRLTRQELRHAKFDGWFISFVETETPREEWRELGIATTAREKRMADTQYISELLLVILERNVLGFDQDVLDDLYAKYDDPYDPETLPDFSEDSFMAELGAVKSYLMKMETANHVITKYGRTLANFYTIWSIVALNVEQLPSPEDVAKKYSTFMDRVERLSEETDLPAFLKSRKSAIWQQALSYLENARGASTDLGPRQKRFEVLREALCD